MARMAHGTVGRRKALRWMGAGLLSAGIPFPGQEEPEPSPPDAEKYVKPARPPLPTRVSVVGTGGALGADREKLRRALDRSMDLCHGLARFKRGDRVLLKTATNSDHEFPATTSPELLTAVIHLLRDFGVGEIIVADRSGVWRDTLKCLGRTGLFDAASKAGAKVVALEFAPWKSVPFPKETHWVAPFKVPRLLDEVDRVVSLPTLRTHFLSGFTLALKNNVGLVDMMSRMHMHIPLRLDERLAEISMVVRPDLYVLDARQAFIDGGPDKGRLAEGGAIVSGVDPVAVDATGAALLRLLGAAGPVGKTSPWNLPQIRRAVELEIGAANKEDILHLFRNIKEQDRILSLLA